MASKILFSKISIIAGNKPQRGDVIVFKAPEQALIRTGLGATRAALQKILR